MFHRPAVYRLQWNEALGDGDLVDVVPQPEVVITEALVSGDIRDLSDAATQTRLEEARTWHGTVHNPLEYNAFFQSNPTLLFYTAHLYAQRAKGKRRQCPPIPAMPHHVFVCRTR